MSSQLTEAELAAFAALDLKPDSCKRYTIGDDTHKEISRFATMKAEYEKLGPEPSNTRYGYVVPTGPIDHTVFA